MISLTGLTVATLGGWETFVMRVGWCEHARAVPLTRMSSTMMEREGMVNPNSLLYLRVECFGSGGERGKRGGEGDKESWTHSLVKMHHVLHLRVKAFSKSPWRLLVSLPPTLRSGAHMSAQSVFS